MTRDAMQRLLVPRSIALIGSGAWTDAVAAGSRAIGFRGELWRIHPTRKSTADARYFRSVEELPAAPDAAFVATPNHEAVNVTGALARRGAGGFVCFAAGFSETATDAGHELTRQLVASAGDLPFLGPNCYGMVNFLDRIALWPDQVVGEPVERGVALVCQSGTIALTLMFNDRSLPIAYIITVGNQTRVAVEDLIETLCGDPRVTAIGLYVEGIKDARRFARAVATARAAGKGIAAIKTGRTAAAARTARSHTGALAGDDGVFDAFCRQAGLARCDTLASLCETLKVLHVGGPLPGRRVLVMGASGGDMATSADIARNLELEFPPIPEDRAIELRQILGRGVEVANPFDFHTYLWFDHSALRRLFSAAMRCDFDAVGFMLDCPPQGRADSSAFLPVIDQFNAASAGTKSRAMLIASLPETLSAATRRRCLDCGVTPLQGQREALEALAGAAAIGAATAAGEPVPLRIPGPATGAGFTLSERDGKAALAQCGVRVPRCQVVSPADAAVAAATIGFPVVIKAVKTGLEHKSDAGGVALDVRTMAEAAAVAGRLARLSDLLLVEEMIADGVAEILVGAAVDAQFGQILLIGAGGTLTELFRDRAILLPPWTRQRIDDALRRLSVYRLLSGFRGRPAGDLAALLDTITGIGRYADLNADALIELDVNPVIVRPDGRGAVAVDTLIRLAGETPNA